MMKEHRALGTGYIPHSGDICALFCVERGHYSSWNQNINVVMIVSLSQTYAVWISPSKSVLRWFRIFLKTAQYIMTSFVNVCIFRLPGMRISNLFGLCMMAVPICLTEKEGIQIFAWCQEENAHRLQRILQRISNWFAMLWRASP